MRSKFCVRSGLIKLSQNKFSAWEVSTSFRFGDVSHTGSTATGLSVHMADGDDECKT